MTNFKDAVASLWVKNFMAKHGVLPGDPNVKAESVAPAKSGLLPAVLAAALTAAGMPIVGGLVNWYFSKPAAQTTTDAPPSQTAPQQDGSLYQYLEDHNLHLPE